MTTATREAEELLKESLKELESAKGSVLTGVQKLVRAARLLGDEDVAIWCEVQFGNTKYTVPLKRHSDLINTLIDAGLDYASKKLTVREGVKRLSLSRQVEHNDEAMRHVGLKPDLHCTAEELLIKFSPDGGGYQGIGVIEGIYADLLRLKKGNDGVYYRDPLSRHINYVKRTAHEKATRLYNRVAFSNTPQTGLDILRAEVDGKLLDFSPGLAEKLMIAFKSVASENPEEWSQALTTCRRFLEALADMLYPPRDAPMNGRAVGKAQYINRLWAFMDGAIQSESNKELAKAHAVFLGNYLEKVHLLGHKGVHAELKKVEAIKAVFHTYLIVADILDYLKERSGARNEKINIHIATLDELESVLGVSRNVAKEIIKLRVEYGVLDLSRLATIKGIGKKTLSEARQLLSFEPVKLSDEI
jgi:DNA uptake protein ComE-like DNA-binding protein